jgi:hypothetical protein
MAVQNTEMIANITASVNRALESLNTMAERDEVAAAEFAENRIAAAVAILANAPSLLAAYAGTETAAVSAPRAARVIRSGKGEWQITQVKI